MKKRIMVTLMVLALASVFAERYEWKGNFNACILEEYEQDGCYVFTMFYFEIDTKEAILFTVVTSETAYDVPKILYNTFIKYLTMARDITIQSFLPFIIKLSPLVDDYDFEVKDITLDGIPFLEYEFKYIIN